MTLLAVPEGGKSSQASPPKGSAASRFHNRRFTTGCASRRPQQGSTAARTLPTPTEAQVDASERSMPPSQAVHNADRRKRGGGGRGRGRTICCCWGICCGGGVIFCCGGGGSGIISSWGRGGPLYHWFVEGTGASCGTMGSPGGAGSMPCWRSWPEGALRGLSAGAGMFIMGRPPPCMFMGGARPPRRAGPPR